MKRLIFLKLLLFASLAAAAPENFFRIKTAVTVDGKSVGKMTLVTREREPAMLAQTNEDGTTELKVRVVVFKESGRKKGLVAKATVEYRADGRTLEAASDTLVKLGVETTVELKPTVGSPKTKMLLKILAQKETSSPSGR